MRVIVTGSRRYRFAKMNGLLKKALWDLNAPPGKGLTIIHGGATGADTVAHHIAEEWGANEWVFRAEWEIYGKFAGPMRNAEMMQYKPDHVLAFPLDGSVGTWDCVTQAHKHDIPVTVIGSDPWGETRSTATSKDKTKTDESA